MFYLENSQMETTLRFGDVIQDFPVCFPVIDKPSSKEPFHIKVSTQTHVVVLSPCCSISDKLLAVAPLEKLSAKFFSNPYLAEDLTRINIKIPAEKSLPPDAWEEMSSEEKVNRLAKDDAYVLVDNFIYAPYALFPEYKVDRRNGNISTGHYYIDFRTSIRISYGQITNPKFQPGPCKVLQLSVETREQLRKKIASFYQRVPAEEAALLAS